MRIQKQQQSQKDLNSFSDAHGVSRRTPETKQNQTK